MEMLIVEIYIYFTDALRNFAHLCETLRNSYYAEARRGAQRYAKNYQQTFLTAIPLTLK